MKKRNNQNNKILINVISVFVIIISITMTIGYSVYESNLAIDNSLLTIRTDKEVRVTSVQVNTLLSNANVNFVDYNVDEVYSDIILPSENSSIEYKIIAKNYGNVEIGISNITVNEEYKDILTVESIQIKDKLRDNNNTCEEDINGCKLTIEGEFYVTLKYQDGAYNSNNINFNNVTLKIEFNEAFNVQINNFTNLNPTMKDLVAIKNTDYEIFLKKMYINLKKWYDIPQIEFFED